MSFLAELRRRNVIRDPGVLRIVSRRVVLQRPTPALTLFRTVRTVLA
ncbi:MAG: hypothetical protein KA505_01645 [Xanthomonadales bacterium]|nr:hypothetical protein [Xanthomonadales bacterium]